MILRRLLSTASLHKTTVLSGIQPTGVMHLGNYFGAIKQWVQLQESHDCLFSIVDLHAITMPQDPQVLRDSIMTMTATLIGCGINPEKCTLFQQSSVPYHGQLSWILSTMTMMAKLSGLPQYKDKTEGMKEVPLGLLAYPVLQCADIMLYKANLIPVGEDQMQQIHLAQHLIQKFNHRFKVKMFPRPEALLNKAEFSSRIKSLRKPDKKMSKSEPDAKSRIELLDSPEVIVSKIKKSVTDFTSNVTYDPEKRPGVSNLILIDSLITNKTTETIVNESSSLTTAQYKLQLADRVVEYLSPMRSRTVHLLEDKDELCKILARGQHKAFERAEVTMKDVYKCLGL